MIKHRNLLLDPNATEAGGAAVAAPPAASAPESAVSTPSPSESLPQGDSAPSTSIPERVSPITPEIAEQLGIDTPKPIKVEPMKALGLNSTPREGINALIQKSAEKIQRNIPFVKPTPQATTPSGQAPIVQKTPAPAQPTPSAPAAPRPSAPAQPAAPTPAAPQTFEVQGRKYTPEQMQAILEDRASRQPVPQAQPQPQVPQQPTQQLSPQQQAEAQNQRESSFINELAPQINLERAGLRVTPDQADVMAAGGEPAANMLNGMMQRAVAYGALTGRKSIAHELNPILKFMDQRHAQDVTRFQQALAPIQEQARSVAAWETEQAFVNAHPDLAPHMDNARIVAHAMIEQAPQWAASVSREDFVKAVGEQTRNVLKNFGIEITPAQTSVPASATPPAASQAPKQPAPVKAAVTPSGMKPITGQRPNAPAAVTKPVQTKRDFQKVAIDSMASTR